MNFYTQKTIILMIVVCIISDSGFSDDVVCLDCLDTLKSVEIPITTESYETYTFFFDWWTKNGFYNYSGNQNVSSDILCPVKKWGNKYGLKICNSIVNKRKRGPRNAKNFCIEIFNLREDRFYINSNEFIESCTTEIENDGLKYDYGFDNFAFQRLNFNIESNLSESTKMYIKYLNDELRTIENSGFYALGTGPLCCIKDLKAAGFKIIHGKHSDSIIYDNEDIEAARIEGSQMHDLSLSPTDVNLSDSYDIDRYIENDYSDDGYNEYGNMPYQHYFDGYNGYGNIPHHQEYRDLSNMKYTRWYDMVGSYNKKLIRVKYINDCGRIKNIVTQEYCQFVHDNYDSQIKVIHDFKNNEIQHREELTKRSYLEDYNIWCWHYYRNQ